jgi:hypothetical protein
MQTGRSIGRIIFAYAQAPWRRQRQLIGTVLLGVVGLAMISALYLDVTSQAAIAGRQIQIMADALTSIQRANADLESQLAAATSTEAMQARALALGFEPIDASQLEYVQVPGYQPPEPAILAGARSLRPSAASMPPEYTESLFAWFGERFGGQGGLASGAGR